MHHRLVDIIGVIGALLILLGFYRTSIGRWTGKSLWYELDNLTGAAFLIVYSYEKAAYVSIVLNVVWAAVAFKGAVSIAERRKARKRAK